MQAMHWAVHNKGGGNGTRVVLTSTAYVHLKQADFSKYTRNLSPASEAIFLSGPAELYQQMLAKSLAHHFEAKLMLLDVTDFSLKIPSKYRSGNKAYVERNIDLVYGGGSIGLMGLVSQVVHAGGRHVLGVIPKSLMPKEITGEPVGEVRAVSDMHERKAEMARQADAFIALPGGYGTLEELLEVITWAQLGIHSKPVGLLNVDGYYNSLLSFMDLAVDEEFISRKARRIIVSAPSAKELVRKLEEYVPQPDEFVSKLSWDVEPVKLVAEVEPGIASAS